MLGALLIVFPRTAGPLAGNGVKNRKIGPIFTFLLREETFNSFRLQQIHDDADTPIALSPRPSFETIPTRTKMADSSEVDVDEFCLVTGATRERARFYLEAAGGNIQAALDSFFNQDVATDDVNL